MRRLYLLAICLMSVTIGLMGLYEVTAKSPRLIGHPLPLWQETRQVERHTPWNPTTGIFPLDKMIHEGQEALRFYGLMA